MPEEKIAPLRERRVDDGSEQPPEILPEPKQEQAREGIAPQRSDAKLQEVLQKLGGTGSAALTPQVGDDVRNVALIANADNQVERLLDLAAEKGVSHAVAVAQKLKEAYVVDRLHDELLTKFHQGLAKRRLR